MLKLCGNKSGRGQNTDRESEKRKKLKETDSFSLSLQLKDITVRIVHPGGKVDMYDCAISAAQLLKNYPGRHVALPDFFNRPHESLLTADDILLPGQKYLVIPSSSVEKLKHRHTHKAKHPTEIEEPKFDGKEVVNVNEDCSEDSISLAKHFYASKERWSGWLWKKMQQEKKSFIPPIPTLKSWRDSRWEPNLESIEEISP